MAGVLTQDLPNRAFVSQSYQEPPPEYTVPVVTTIIEHSPDKTVAVVVPRVKPEAGNNAELGVHGNVGKMMAESYEEARMRNIENGMREIPKPKNHIQANIQRMRLIQKKSKANERSKVCVRSSNKKKVIFLLRKLRRPSKRSGVAANTRRWSRALRSTIRGSGRPRKTDHVRARPQRNPENGSKILFFTHIS
jgi:hypothetical protein